MPRKQNSWAAIDPIPSSSIPKPSTSNSVRVLVLKEKGSIIPKGKKGKEKVTSSALKSNQIVADRVKPISIESLSLNSSSLISQTVETSSNNASVVIESKSGSTLLRSEFPSLPAPYPKNKFRNGGGSTSSHAWGAGPVQDGLEEESSFSTQQSRSGGKKQGKNKGKVLMKFG